MEHHSVKHTALHTRHVNLGARMGEFAGFMMPLWYSSIKEEHDAVRNGVGLFDLSHMGEFFINGPQAFDLCQYLTCNDVRRIGPACPRNPQPATHPFRLPRPLLPGPLTLRGDSP